MPEPSGGLHKELFGTLLTDVDSTAKEDVGALRADEDGNIYIYLKGVVAVVVGDVVTYKILSATDSTVVRAVAGSKGPLAVAMAAIVASKYGWFQTIGFNAAVKAISTGDAAAGGRVFLTSTAGSVDDVQVFGDEIQGMIFTVQEGEGSSGDGFAGVHLTNPRVAEARVKPVLTQVDAAALLIVGSRYRDDETGKEYIYLKGIGSVVVGSVVTYQITTTALSTTLLAIVNGKGHVAVAMGIIVAGKFGWFQIAGLNLVTQADDSAAVGPAYLGGDTGGIDSTKVVGDHINNMVITVAESGGVVGVHMLYPYAFDDSN